MSSLAPPTFSDNELVLLGLLHKTPCLSPMQLNALAKNRVSLKDCVSITKDLLKRSEIEKKTQVPQYSLHPGSYYLQYVAFNGNKETESTPTKEKADTWKAEYALVESYMSAATGWVTAKQVFDRLQQGKMQFNTKDLLNALCEEGKVVTKQATDGLATLWKNAHIAKRHEQHKSLQKTRKEVWDAEVQKVKNYMLRTTHPVSGREVYEHVKPLVHSVGEVLSFLAEKDKSVQEKKTQHGHSLWISTHLQKQSCDRILRLFVKENEWIEERELERISPIKGKLFRNLLATMFKERVLDMECALGDRTYWKKGGLQPPLNPLPKGGVKSPLNSRIITSSNQKSSDEEYSQSEFTVDSMNDTSGDAHRKAVMDVFNAHSGKGLSDIWLRRESGLQFDAFARVMDSLWDEGTLEEYKDGTGENLYVLNDRQTLVTEDVPRESVSNENCFSILTEQGTLDAESAILLDHPLEVESGTHSEAYDARRMKQLCDEYVNMRITLESFKYAIQSMSEKLEKM
jgi:hypothetical protein